MPTVRKAIEMKQTLACLALTTILMGCSATSPIEDAPNSRDSAAFDRSVWAAETMEAFGYAPERYAAGAGMATVDDFSAPRIVGGPSGYAVILVDGHSVNRSGANPDIDYVPYAWIAAGVRLLEFELRQESLRDGRPLRISLRVEMKERAHYLPRWNGKELELQEW